MRRSQMKKILVPLMLIAVFILFAISTSIAQDQPAKEPARMKAHDFPPFLKDMLNLTPEQEARLKELSKARLEERQAFQEKMTKMRGELREMMKDPKADEKKIEGLVDEMFKLRAAQFKNNIKQRNEIKKIFTPEQLEKMEKFRTRFMGRQMRRPGRFFPGRRFSPWGGLFGPERFGLPWDRGFGFRGRILRNRMGWWWW